MKKLYIRIFTMLTLLLLGGMANEAWAYKITYHILTLPMTSEIPGNTKSDYYGWRMEALRVIVDGVTTVQELPAHFRSPLAKNFKYYFDDVASIDKDDGTAKSIYANNIHNKYFLYKVKDGAVDKKDAAITNNCDIYVTYEYDENNGIAKLDGSEKYIIGIHNGFLAYNKGRNNRLAVMPKKYNGEYIVEGESLCSDDFNKVNINGKGTNITTWWNDNKTPKATAESYFHFLFKYVGCDPYNITIMTAYEGDDCYYEKWASDPDVMKKYYKWGTVFSTQKITTDQVLIASDDNRQYNTLYTGGDVSSTDKPGYYRGIEGHIWNSFALLNNTTNDGYVYIGTRCVDGNGNISNPSNNQYYYLNVKTNNELMFGLMNASTATANNSVDKKMYEVFTYTFHVTTPFGNVLSAEKNWPEPYGDVVIQSKHVPASLLRKYCSIVGFYKDAALTQPITTFGEATDKHIYVKYQVTGAPFNAIRPSDSYSDATWAAATWYELTDKDNTTDRKIKWNGSNNFQNNGVSATYEKESEYAFIGDPYELQVVLRSQTSGSTPYYLGSPFGVLSRTADIVYGTNYEFYEHAASQTMTFNVSGLRGDKKIKVTTGGTHASQITTISPNHSSVTAESSTSQTYTVTLAASGGTARTMTITIQEYDTDGTTELGPPTVITIHQSKAGYSWEIPADDINGSILLRKFNDEGHWYWDTSGTNQNVSYSTSNSTRVKVMEVGKLNYTFKVVDLSGRVAIQATEALTPFTKLTGYANIPASIRSPFIADETVTFYGSYEDRDDISGRDRRDWHSPSEQATLTELPGASCDVFVSYTTSELTKKNIKLLYSQEFNIKLNGEYIYWNSAAGANQNKILSENLSADDAKLENAAYLWHLRGRDPYCMRIDNKGYSEQQFGTPASETTANMYKPIGDGTLTDGSPEAIANGMFVHWADNQALDFVNNRDDGTRFIAMMSNNVGVYEVLVATGTTDYYRIGRASTPGAETKIYANSTYAHGADQLRFELAGKKVVTYHLIDKSGTEIFRDEDIKSSNPRLALPEEYVSPLVEAYHYYIYSDFTISNGPDGVENTADDIFVLNDGATELSEYGNNTDIYVVYDVSDRIDFGTSHPHMLRFHNGKSYYLEDGADKLDTSGRIQAVYPYCNGDGNLNIYGSDMNEEQMAGGASTRPRWVWYLESGNNDPYHVKIHSKSTISFNGASNTTYLRTYAVHFDQDAPNVQHIVTGGHFPGISGQPATEYAILGVTGRYKLLTINKITANLDLDGDGDVDEVVNQHQYVTSFEQYWKTYNMVRQFVLGDARVDKTNADAFDDPITMPAERWDELKTKLTALGLNDVDDAANRVDGCSWHSYEAIANATRWNGYNDINDVSTGYEKKKVERLQHWFQTFDMGDGTFDIESADIPAVLVLLDRHGWEIMRKPIPTGTSDLDAEAKLDVLRAYDSPMVKQYTFYSNATKDSGCHRYSLRMQSGKERDTITVNGVRYTSTSLATLPPYVADRDLFVTYTVKEEYDKSYDPSTQTASQFIVLQDHKYATANGSSITATNAPTPLSSTIIANNGTFSNASLWYAQPNRYIDSEMGHPTVTVENPNGTVTTYSDGNPDGFDPYNLQLKNVSTSKFFTIGMTKSVLSGGQYSGEYPSGSIPVTLAEAKTGNSRVDSPESYDHSTLHMTNQTFMVVQDANGNMQLMPRFDHTHRINAFATLEEPDMTQTVKHDVDDSSPGEQTTFMVRPVVHDYRIIDNQGNVAMRYLTGGESYPSMPEHFKSPLATNFRYYATLDDANNDGVYELPSLANEITSSFAAAGVTYSNNRANIYIRYEYDESADIEHENILQGRWMTVSLGNNSGNLQWVYYNGTLNTGSAGLYTNTKPATSEDLKAAKQWHWKFLQNPIAETSPRYKAPDPYAVEIYNREANNSDADMATAISVGGVNRYVILSHPDGDYALAKASDDINSYSFLNGNGMTAHDAGSAQSAQIVADGNFSTSNNDINDGARIIFSNDIKHTYVYNVITNAQHLAASKVQSEAVAISNGYKPVTPEEIQTPLLNLEDYIYYGTATESEGVYTIDQESQLRSLYGLYDDVVYVRYPAFDIEDSPYDTPYLVPNKKNTSGSHVDRDSESNDVAIDINGDLPYNIIWYNDNMMTSDGSTISDGGSQEINGASQYVWYFEGGDPYAIKIKKTTNKYVDGTSELKATAKNFMLLKKSGYDYGVFAETGNQDNMLSFDHSTDPVVSLSTSDPNHFIPFALSTHQLIYHLVINTTGNNTSIPYRVGTEKSWKNDAQWRAWQVTDVDNIPGTTQRDLTSAVNGISGDRYQLGETILGQTYCVDAGQVSIGDILEPPTEFDRPNCVYFYYIDNIQTKGAIGTYQKTATDESDMNTQLASVSVVGNYYFKIAYQYVKVQVTEAADGGKPAAYEVSLISASDYTSSNSSLAATNADDLKSKADALDATGDYYYKVGPIDLYKRAEVTALTPLTSTIVDCTKDDWDNAWQDNTTLNNRYKGLKVTKLMSDTELIGSVVKVNVAYAFKTGLDTNVGEGFVTSVDDNLWYTFETSDATPYLAHYTNAWGLQSMAGRDTRYTNDYLWTPLGDVYGFKMYNRYVYKTSNEPARVMTTESLGVDVNLKMLEPVESSPDAAKNQILKNGNEVYELLAEETTTPGYFLIHPVINNSGTQYYIKKDATDDYTKLDVRANATEWTFGLTEDIVKPYYDRAGYVGGLTAAGKTAYEAASTLQAKQAIVYNDAYIVQYTPGYYRLHNQPGVSGLNTVRYASGYLHKIESDQNSDDNESDAIPMHFYSRTNKSTTFEGEGGLMSGFTKTNATQGEIPVLATEYDPSTIFYFSGSAAVAPAHPTSTMQTQGLYVASNDMGDTDNGAKTNRIQRAVMSATAGNALNLTLMDIGGAVLLIHDGTTPATRMYLNFDQSNFFQRTAASVEDMNTQAKEFTSKGTYYFKIGESTYTYKSLEVTTAYDGTTDAVYSVAAESPLESEWNAAADIYDLKYYHDSPTDDAKWCLEPANNQGLMITTNDGGDGYFYATFYAPFDVLLPDNSGSNNYYAYYCTKWNTEAADNNPRIYPKRVPKSGDYAEGKFVPAGTPVIIRTTSNTGSVKLTLPNNSATTPLNSLSCVFMGTYLEQLLAAEITDDVKVYAFGLPITGYDITEDPGDDNGKILDYVDGVHDTKGVGFYLNATPNKELDWTPNNRYVLHNKIYYRGTFVSGSSSRQDADTRGVQFIPVIFDVEEEQPGEEQTAVNGLPVDNRIYDLQGRCVATEQQVLDGTWRTLLSRGIYILNGRKFRK